MNAIEATLLGRDLAPALNLRDAVDGRDLSQAPLDVVRFVQELVISGTPLGACFLAPFIQPPTVDAPVQPPSNLLSYLTGSWVGTVTQANAPPPYPISVTISDGAVGSRIAVGSCATLGCSVEWTLASIDSPSITVREVVQSGSRCGDVDITLTLQPDGGLDYVFENGNGRATLRRIT